MGRIAERSKLSPEEYLAWERRQERKHEYFDGEVFAMAAGSYRHNRLIMKVGFALEPSLAARGCTVVASDQRVRAQHRRYVYPDVTVVCGAPAIEHDDVLTNPTVLVEVLSSTTEQYDRGLKWNSYQALASLTDYLLVSQERAHIEHFARIDNRWIYASANAGERITLTSGSVLDIDTIFAGVFDLPGD
jgi:Uma2 family endonuclease